VRHLAEGCVGRRNPERSRDALRRVRNDDGAAVDGAVAEPLVGVGDAVEREPLDVGGILPWRASSSTSISSTALPQLKSAIAHANGSDPKRKAWVRHPRGRPR
jgi:hypothetical protein